MQKIPSVLALATAAFLLWSCGGGGKGPAADAPAELKGLAIELAPEAPIPAGAQARVRIVAISTPDQRFIHDSTLPVPADNVLQVRYDASRVDQAQDYNIDVTIIENGKRVAGNASDALALTKGRGDRVRVVLK